MVSSFAYCGHYAILPYIMVSKSINGYKSFSTVLTHTHKKNPLSVGVKVEGILRQSADVEEVKRRIQDYEKGDFFGLNLFFSYLG
jgi:hypothetical protein